MHPECGTSSRPDAQSIKAKEEFREKMMQDKSHHHNPGMDNKCPRWENTGKEGSLPMLEHVVSLLSALVSIIGIIRDNLGGRR